MKMFGILRQFEESDRLTRLRAIFKTAKDLGKKECVKCGYCCNQRSCIPTPKELIKIAEFLKLSPQDCINTYFAVDKKNGDSNLYVKPIGVNQMDLKGKFIPSERTFNEGKCIFLDENNLCKIHSVKPQAARQLECWNTNKEFFDSVKEWKKTTLKNKFKIELGEEK
jgi:Fe-S-cluster containining protein